MPPARPAHPALTDAEVADLRAQLDRGSTPRVRLRGGGTGAVVSVGDPEADGPEYIRVKVTLNGTRDTLPYAPEDLASAARGAKAAAAALGSPPPSVPTKAKRQPSRNPQLRTAPNVVITLRTAGAEWLVDAARDGTTITEGAGVSAEVVQAVADHLHDARLSGAVADVASVRRSEAAGRVERLRAELTAAEALLATYAPGNSARGRRG